MFAIMFQTLPFSAQTVDRQSFFDYYTGQETLSQFFGIHYQNFFPADERHSDAAMQLIFAGLNPNPADRPTIEEVMSNEWISGAPQALD